MRVGYVFYLLFYCQSFTPGKKMKVLNLTPHAVQVYDEAQFVGLEQTNPTTWIADGVQGIPVAEYPSHGVARIGVETSPVGSSLPGVVVETTYGEATGIPHDLKGDEYLIVSLPMQNMAKSAGLASAGQMVAPYRVVRSRADGSKVLGCMGFTY